MITGILWAIIAGLMLGLYALPEKFTKDFAFEKTWSLFFAINTFVVPNLAALLLIDGFTGILSSIPVGVLTGMIISSLLWGIGMLMWGKAINHIGMSLGFSIFIGTVILVGSLIPFFLRGVPATPALLTILTGIAVVLVGIIANGTAGMTRQRDENEDANGDGSMGLGILIAVVGGLLATGFSYANTLGFDSIHEASQAAGNAAWKSSIIVMYVVYLSGGVAIAIYFAQQLTVKKRWGNFVTRRFGYNAVLASIMGILNFAASVAFAYAAFSLGNTGGTVGYAIFNTVAVTVAIMGGIITGEWVKASGKARRLLYIGLSCMIGGILIVAVGNGLSA